MTIDLTQLSPPDVIEALDVEIIIEQALMQLRELDSNFTATVESDPAYKLIQVMAYREMLLRQRINDATRAVMVAQATGNDLDNLGALFGVERLILDLGDPTGTPPRPSTFENDLDFRARIPQAFEGLSVAGPEGAYKYHALSVSAKVHDVSVTSPSPGRVDIVVLPKQPNKISEVELNDVIRKITLRLNSEDIRPLTDFVNIKKAEVIAYSIDLTVSVYADVDKQFVKKSVVEKLQKFSSEQFWLGKDINQASIIAAAHIEGVENISITTPAVDLINGPSQAAYCEDFVVTVEDDND